MAQRKGQICILFDQVPEGTHYREGAYSWVPEGEGRQYIDKGYGKEYDPSRGETEDLEPAEPEDDYPSDFPEAIKNICKQDDKAFDDVESLHEDDDLQSINGVGDSTETKIKNYFE
jgi:hypothetical protein